MVTARTLLAMPAANPAAAEAVEEFIQRVAGIDITCCPHCNTGRWLTIGCQAPLRSRYIGTKMGETHDGALNCWDHRDHNGLCKSIHVQRAASEKGPSRDGTQRLRRRAASCTATRACCPARDTLDGTPSGDQRTRHC